MRSSVSHRQIAFQTSNNPRQLLQGAPVVEAFLFGFDQRLAWVAVLVEVFREAAFRAREADEVIDLVRLRLDEEVRFLGRITLEAEALRDLVAFARIVDEHRESARVHGEFALLHRHVVADAVFGLARRINAHHRRAVVFVRGHDGFVEVIRHRATGLRHERVPMTSDQQPVLTAQVQMESLLPCALTAQPKLTNLKLYLKPLACISHHKVQVTDLKYRRRAIRRGDFVH